MNATRGRASRPFLAAAFALTVVVFLAVYWKSFQVLPASDDFPYITEIHRGDRDGVQALFTRSVTGGTYRPLTSVGLWAFGNLFADRPTVGIRLLHLLSAISYAAVALLWIRCGRLGRTGGVVVISMMLLHPILPQAVGSIDGFNSLTSSAMLWLAAWIVLVCRRRLAFAMSGAALCFVIGAGFKEYAFAIVPLSVLTVLCFWTRHRVVGAVSIGLLLGLLLWGSIAVRQLTVEAGAHQGWGYIDFEPLHLIRNIVRNVFLLVGGILFLGNSIWAYVNNESMPVVMTVMTAMVLLVGIVVWGLLLRGEEPRIDPATDATEPANSLARWMWFLALSLPATMFPAVVMIHVSEMYAPPLVMPLALLCGLAADGLARQGILVRSLAGAAAIVALVSSVMTIRVKVDGLVNVGRRADRQLRQIVAFIPPDARNKVIAVRYQGRQNRHGDLYGVFRIPDEQLLVHRTVLEWPLPGRGHILDSQSVESDSLIILNEFDIVLLWNAPEQKFIAVKP